MSLFMRSGAADYDYDDQAGEDDLAGYKPGDAQAEGRDQAAYDDSQEQYGDQQLQEEDSFQGRDGQEQYESDQEQYNDSTGAEPKSSNNSATNDVAEYNEQEQYGDHQDQEKDDLQGREQQEKYESDQDQYTEAQVKELWASKSKSSSPDDNNAEEQS